MATQGRQWGAVALLWVACGRLGAVGTLSQPYAVRRTRDAASELWGGLKGEAPTRTDLRSGSVHKTSVAHVKVDPLASTKPLLDGCYGKT